MAGKRTNSWRQSRIRELEQRVAELEVINAALRDQHGANAVAATVDQQAVERAARLQEAQLQLQQSLAIVRATLQSTADGILVIDRFGRAVDFNEKFVDMWRVPRALLEPDREQDLLAHLLDQLVDGDELGPRIRSLYDTPYVDLLDEVRFKDGRVFECHAVPQRIDGHTVGRVWSFRDISARRTAEGMNARLGRILDSSSNEIFVFEPDDLRFVQVNQAAQRNLGYSAITLSRYTLPKLMGITRDAFVGQLQPLIAGDVEECHFETAFIRRDGSRYPVEVRLQLSRDEQPAVFVAIVEDISERRRSEARLRYLANYDSLTGLPNRLLFRDRLGQAMDRARREQRYVAVLFLDLDRFKDVNDTLGHGTGDRLLQLVAERIRDCLRASDTLARQGGDEFIVLLGDIPYPEAASGVARKIIGSLGQPFAVEGQQIYSSVSIGISVFPGDADTIDGLLRNADAAMYLAKEQGRSNYRFFTPDLNVRAQERLLLESRLRTAQESGELLLYYQPQFDLQSRALCGFEALLRWRHPDLGMIEPEVFIPIAEETGMIVPIGEWTLRTACAQWRHWHDEGLSPGVMSVNMSVRQFRQADAAAMLERVVQETGMDPAWLELELTESTLMTDADISSGILEKLKAVGVQLAIDDFGTGYSSLSYLKRFPIDTVKIDRTFVRDIGVDADDAAIVEAIIALAHVLKLRVVAEGVEHEDQQDFLMRQCCDVAQGYLLGGPTPVERADAMLRAASLDARNSGSSR